MIYIDVAFLLKYIYGGIFTGLDTAVARLLPLRHLKKRVAFIYSVIEAVLGSMALLTRELCFSPRVDRVGLRANVSGGAVVLSVLFRTDTEITGGEPALDDYISLGIEKRHFDTLRRLSEEGDFQILLSRRKRMSSIDFIINTVTLPENAPEINYGEFDGIGKFIEYIETL